MYLRRLKHLTEVKSAVFDFDDTLTELAPVATGGFAHSDEDGNPWVLGEVFRLAIEKWKIHIVTERKKTNKNKKVISDFIKKYKLPIVTTEYTEGNPKIQAVKRIGAELFYDDDPLEFDIMLGDPEMKNTTMILVPTPYNAAPE